MADETIELGQVEAVIAGLSSPTNEQFMQALRGYSDTAVALAGAKGGGGASTNTERASYAGNPVSVPDNPAGIHTALTWDSLGSGAALLDLTNPEYPEVITGGIYAVTAVAHAAEVLSVGATFAATLHLDLFGDDAVCEMTSNDQGTGAEIEAMVSLACTYYIPAGGVIALTVLLDDGTAARDFNLREAMIQRLS